MMRMVKMSKRKPTRNWTVDRRSEESDPNRGRFVAVANDHVYIPTPVAVSLSNYFCDGGYICSYKPFLSCSLLPIMLPQRRREAHLKHSSVGRVSDREILWDTQFSRIERIGGCN